MPLAPICECEHPLTIELDDWCSYCSRSTTALTEVPRVEDEYTPIELAAQMYAAGTGIKTIIAETGVGELTILRECDRARYEERRSAKYAHDDARRRRLRLIAPDPNNAEIDFAAIVEQEQRDRDERDRRFQQGMDRFEAIRIARGPKEEMTREGVLGIQALLSEITPSGKRRWTFNEIGAMIGCSAFVVREMNREGCVESRLARFDRREAKAKATADRASGMAELTKRYADLPPFNKKSRSLYHAAIAEITAIRTAEGRQRWPRPDIAEILGIDSKEVKTAMDNQRSARRYAKRKSVRMEATTRAA